MLFFEVDERGCVSPLAAWQGCSAPASGTIVMAKNHSHAVELYQRYRDGDTFLKRNVNVPGYSNSCKNIICES